MFSVMFATQTLGSYALSFSDQDHITDLRGSILRKLSEISF
jgi:hypothetical protein